MSTPNGLLKQIYRQILVWVLKVAKITHFYFLKLPVEVAFMVEIECIENTVGGPIML